MQVTEARYTINIKTGGRDTLKVHISANSYTKKHAHKMREN